MANPIKKCILHSGQSDGTMVDLYPRTNLASVADMTAFSRTLNGAADAETARNTLEIQTSKDIINIIYPVGSVITLTNDTDPNKLYKGTTWVKMDAGRVLVSAGTYTENGTTYTYNLGDKGGEAKHQITIEEMPSHTHGAWMSAVGQHAHTYSVTSNSGSGQSAGWSNHAGASWATSTNGEHSHQIGINNTGGGNSHENRQPYQVINRWKRTA